MIDHKQKLKQFGQFLEERRRDFLAWQNYDHERLRKLPALQAAFDERVDRRTILVSALLTLLIHVLLFASIPWRIEAEQNRAPDWTREIEVVYEQPEEEPMRFVETNPEVPTNAPDQTENFAAREQQAAQEEPTQPSPDRNPFIKGDEEESPRLVSGDIMAEPTPLVAPAPAAQESVQAQIDRVTPPPPPRAPQFIEQEIDSEDGLASMLEEPDIEEKETKEPRESKEITLNLEETDSKMEAQDKTSMPQQQESQQQQPRPRPRLRPRVTAGPLMDAAGGVTSVGAIAIDAEFHQFGDYLQRMFEAIGYQWNLLATQTRRASSQTYSRVIVEFWVARSGYLHNAQVLFSSAGKAGTLICEDAILSRAPFGEWTEEMVSTLGEKQRVRVTFIYR